MKILMICLGNICRSPMAHGIMEKLIAENNLDWSVESAGTNGFHTGEPPHKDSQRVCKNHGLDISSQRSILFTKQLAMQYDVLFVMAKDVYKDCVRIVENESEQIDKLLYLLDEIYPGEQRDVTDPWYGGPDGYEPVYAEIEKACKAFVERKR
jgi:protein-tyrosine phosphatase